LAEVVVKLRELAAVAEEKPEQEKAPTDERYVQADIALRGVLVWEGADWGSPASVLRAAEGVVNELNRVRRDGGSPASGNLI
jgi:hypothetical protein